MSSNFANRFSRSSALIAAVLVGLASTSAHALTGSANASDVSVHVNLLGIATLDVDPQVPVGFNAAVDATLEHDSLPLLDTGGSLLSLSTGTLVNSAEFNPGSTYSYVQADSDIENLDLSAVSLLGSPLISISADAVHASSDIVGWCNLEQKTGRASRAADLGDMIFFSQFDAGNIFPDYGLGGDPGTVILGGLHISILGIVVPDLPLNPPANTRVDLSALGIVGASLVLNEQTVGGDGTTLSTISHTAIHLTLNVASLITADVQVGHADSTFDCTQ
jgi:hypothetical protein